MQKQFNPNQAEFMKRRLHKLVHWLLLYKDPETAEEFSVDFDFVFTKVLRVTDALNSLCAPENVMNLYASLIAAYNESKREDFRFRLYRSLILDAHSEIDRIEAN